MASKLEELNSKLDKVLSLFTEMEAVKRGVDQLEENNKKLEEAANSTNVTLHTKRGPIQISRYGYFHGPGHEIVKNYWNVSEISLSRREKGHSHCENISHCEKRSLCLRKFHAVKQSELPA